MKGGEFIAFAAKILLLHREEASCRSAISRAYYGAFHLAQSFLDDLDLVSDSNHGHLQHDFLYSGVPEAVEVGQFLQELHSHRVAADYRLHSAAPASFRVAQTCIETAKELELRITELQQLDTSLRQQMVQAITDFRRRVSRRT